MHTHNDATYMLLWLPWHATCTHIALCERLAAAMRYKLWQWVWVGVPCTGKGGCSWQPCWLLATRAMLHSLGSATPQGLVCRQQSKVLFTVSIVVVRERVAWW